MDIKISEAISSIESCFREASNAASDSYHYHQNDSFDEYDQTACFYVEKSFVEVLILLEHLKLTSTHQTVQGIYEIAKTGSLTKSQRGSEEPYLVWIEKLRMYVDGISSIYGLGDTASTELRDLKEIIKRTVYPICDKNLFGRQPAKEADVHDRIEAILKCHFSDLKRKPTLTKPIKNFEPDTGIPSTKTLIEYKFVSNTIDAKRVVDEILADAHGYKSTFWKNLLFVIYETHRVMPEEDWCALLRECELGSSYEVVVLSGDAA